MLWVALFLLVLYSYPLQLMEVQEHLKNRSVSVADANFFVRGVYDWRIRSATTFFGLAVLITALVLLVLDTRWWPPLWLLCGLALGRGVVRITGNPLIGEIGGDRWFNK